MCHETVCPVCDGEGQRYVDDLSASYHAWEPVEVAQECPQCEGTGLVSVVVRNCGEFVSLRYASAYSPKFAELLELAGGDVQKRPSHWITIYLPDLAIGA